MEGLGREFTKKRRQESKQKNILQICYSNTAKSDKRIKLGEYEKFKV